MSTPSSRTRHINWSLDLALLLLVWRLAINPVSSWWRDPPAIVIACWIIVSVTSDRHRRLQQAGQAALIAAMALLFGLFAWRQIPLTLHVLGLR